MNMSFLKILLGLVLTVGLPACTPNSQQITEELEMETKKIIEIRMGEVTSDLELENNEATRALLEILKEGPVTVNMHAYGGFEMVGPLGFSLPAQDRRIKTVPGQVVLYTSNQLVLFTGSNTWEYTKIGNLLDLSFLEEIENRSEISIELSETV